MSVVVNVQAAPRADLERVEQDVAQALYAYLNPLVGGSADGPGAGWEFGRALNQGELYGIVHAVEGVDFVKILRVYETDLVTGEQQAQAGGQLPAARARRADRLGPPRRQGRAPRGREQCHRPDPGDDDLATRRRRGNIERRPASPREPASARASCARGYLRSSHSPDGAPARTTSGMRFVARSRRCSTRSSRRSTRSPPTSIRPRARRHGRRDGRLARDRARRVAGRGAAAGAAPALGRADAVARHARGPRAGAQLTFPDLPLRVEDGGGVAARATRPVICPRPATASSSTATRRSRPSGRPRSRA